MIFFSVFITGAVVLVLEIVGTRVLAPFFGSGLYVWSSLITVTLAYLSAGYYLGGKWADREPSPGRFYHIIFLAGLAMLVLFQYKGVLVLLGEKAGFRFGPLITTNFLFGLPLGLLGMLGPFAIRLATREIGEVGGRTGAIFAFSTLGSLVGALGAGFFLIPVLSVPQIIYGMTIILIGLGLAGEVYFGRQWKKLFKRWYIWLMVLAAAIVLKNWLFPFDFTKAVLVYEKDNFYGHNRVIDFQGKFFGNRCFLVDGMLQSCYREMDENKESIYAKMGEYLEALKPGARVLILGLGGGTILKYHYREDVKFEAVDINPEAIKVAKEFFGLDAETVSFTDATKTILADCKDSFCVFEADARTFLKSRSEGSYDLIINDLYNALFMPEHIVTKEAFALMKSRLKPGGMVVANIIGVVEGDKFVKSLMATAMTSFPYYGLRPLVESGLGNMVLVLSSERRSGLKEEDVIGGIIFTDDKNPVEKLRGDYMGMAKKAGFVQVLPSDYR